MPRPTTVHTLGFEQGRPICNFSVGLDAVVLHSWRDNSTFGASDPDYPYYGVELQVCCWKSALPSSRILARHTGGKLKKDALYQLQGRFFIDTTAEGGKSYLHIDEAVRFQGPGTLRSYRKPHFVMAGEVVSVLERALVMRWVTRDPYRRGMVYEQSAILALEKGLGEKDRMRYEGELCYAEGRMEGLNGRSDWICEGVWLC